MSASGSDDLPTERGPGERPVGYWLKLVDRLIDQSVDDVFLRTGLTRRHWQVLNMVRDGVSDATTVDSVLSPFTSRGRGPGRARRRGQRRDHRPADARLGGPGRGRVGGHGRGSARVPRPARRGLGRAGEACGGITREQYDRTIATLEQMARNLGWSPGDEPLRAARPRSREARGDGWTTAARRAATRVTCRARVHVVPGYPSRPQARLAPRTRRETPRTDD
ncbi:hypothetical protein NKG05_19450 [Oerskovia sp. M15]